MGRSPRIKSYTNVYHIIVRGINKQDILLDKQDYVKFKKEIERAKEKYKFEIYAYSLMKNHVHIVMYDKNENLSLIMQSINISYSNYFNKKYERVGHLFENRFKSHAIENEAYLKNVVRYIHKNPENAGLPKYMWTSYYEYLNNQPKLIETKQVMLLFSNDIHEFKSFHDAYIKNQDYDKKFEMLGRLTDDEAIEIIKEILNENNLMKIQKYPKEAKDVAINKILKIEGITKEQIARIVGISSRTIRNIEKTSEKGQISEKETSPMGT